MGNQRHIIKRQILELQVDSKDSAFNLQERVGDLFRRKIVPLIEAYCDQLSASDRIDRIETLEIDLGTLDPQNLEAELVEKVAAKLPQQLAEKLGVAVLPAAPFATERARSLASIFTPKSGSSIDSRPATTSAVDSSVGRTRPTRQRPTGNHPIAAQLELFQYFIQTGILPWWSQRLNKTELEERFNRLLAAAPAELKTLLRSQLKQEKYLQRIVYQFSDTLLASMTTLFAPVSTQIVESYVRDVQTLFQQVASLKKIPEAQCRLKLWQGILLQLSQSQTAASSGQDRLIRSSLLHLATSFKLEHRTLVQQLHAAVQSTSTDGSKIVPRFESDLPEILAALVQPSLASRTDAMPAVMSSVAALKQDLVAWRAFFDEDSASFAILQQSEDFLQRLEQSYRKLSDRKLSARQSSADAPTSAATVENLRQLLTELDAWIAASETTTVRHPQQPRLIHQMQSQLQTLQLQLDEIARSTAARSTMPKRLDRIDGSPVDVDQRASQLEPAGEFGNRAGTDSVRWVDSFSDTDEIYVYNAGLVILWPFLNRFFE